jgi:hypothetical protein
MKKERREATIFPKQEYIYIYIYKKEAKNEKKNTPLY